MPRLRLCCLLTLVLGVTFTVTAAAQEDLRIAYTDDLKAGVYRTLEELWANAPSEALTYEITGRDPILATWIPRLYRLSPIARKKKLGSIIGFCDGEAVYLAVEAVHFGVRDAAETFVTPVLTRKTDFLRVELLGPESYTELQDCTVGANNATLCRKVPGLIDLKTLEASSFSSVRSFRKVLAADPGLHAEFEAEKRKRRKIREYLIRYVETLRAAGP